MEDAINRGRAVRAAPCAAGFALLIGFCVGGCGKTDEAVPKVGTGQANNAVSGASGFGAAGSAGTAGVAGGTIGVARRCPGALRRARPPAGSPHPQPQVVRGTQEVAPGAPESRVPAAWALRRARTAAGDYRPGSPSAEVRLAPAVLRARATT